MPADRVISNEPHNIPTIQFPERTIASKKTPVALKPPGSLGVQDALD